MNELVTAAGLATGGNVVVTVLFWGAASLATYLGLQGKLVDLLKSGGKQAPQAIEQVIQSVVGQLGGSVPAVLGGKCQLERAMQIVSCLPAEKQLQFIQAGLSEIELFQAVKDYLVDLIGAQANAPK